MHCARSYNALHYDTIIKLDSFCICTANAVVLIKVRNCLAILSRYIVRTFCRLLIASLLKMCGKLRRPTWISVG